VTYREQAGQKKGRENGRGRKRGNIGESGRDGARWRKRRKVHG